MNPPTPTMKLFYLNLLFLLCVLCFPQPAAAGGEPLLLLEKLKTSNGRNKADLLNQVSVAYRNSDRLKSLAYARKAYILSGQNNYVAGEALALKNQGICWFFIGNNDSAATCYTQALERYTTINDIKGISACYNNLGLIAQETGKYSQALSLYQRSIEMDRKLGDMIGVAQTMQNMADIHIYLGEYKAALALTNQCLKIYTEVSHTTGIMESYCNRGAEYDYLRLFPESARDYQKALSLARQLNDKYTEIMVNSNLGVMYWHWQKPDLAMHYLTTALGMSDENDDAYNIDNTLKTLAEIYASRKDYAMSNEIYQKILNRNMALDNKRQVAVILTSIGRNLIELNEIDKALGYLNKSLEITKNLKTPLETIENYRNLVIAHSIMHNFKTADSLQDLFAETYSQIIHHDSLSVKQNQIPGKRLLSPAGFTNQVKWLLSFLLFIFIALLSVIAFRDKAK